MIEMRLQLRATPPATDSMFPRVDQWLYHQQSDHQHALEELAPSRSLDSYRSIVDFLLCEACPEWKLPCRRFYADKGPQVRALCTEAERKVMEAQILVLCEVAYQTFERKRRASWRLVRQAARELAAWLLLQAATVPVRQSRRQRRMRVPRARPGQLGGAVRVRSLRLDPPAARRRLLPGVRRRLPFDAV